MTRSRARLPPPQRLSPSRSTQSDADLSTAPLFAGVTKRSVGGGDLLAPLCGEILVHHRAAARAQLGAMLHHAGGDRGNVRDVRAAELERIARALLARFLAEGKTLRR